MTRMTLTFAAASLTVTLTPPMAVAQSDAPYTAPAPVIAQLLEDGARR